MFSSIKFKIILPIALGACIYALPLQAQVNFKPLERGDYTELEEKIITLKGLEAGLDYGLTLEKTQSNDLPYEKSGTGLSHQGRLNLKTVFHRDVAFHLNLEIGKSSFNNSNIRQSDAGSSSAEDETTAVSAREAYLRYNFNPRSGLLSGRQEISLGDRKGKVFHGLASAITFDCQVATWCMPFGVVQLGKQGGDAINHWSLQYNAWNTEGTGGLNDFLEVEIFRLMYNEGNVPLSKNLGPGQYNPNDPESAGGALPGQVLDGVNPVYYHADETNYFGIRANWEESWFFLNFDITGVKGLRRYHLFKREDGVLAPGDLTGVGAPQSGRYGQRGTAYELEIGARWPENRFGLRYLDASGDKYVDPGTPGSYLRDLRGYHEITPGSYNGAKLYFNGFDSTVDAGTGFGHSINNTKMIGLFYDYEAKESNQLGYSLGIYKLSYNKGIPDINGTYQTDIGLEVDNRLTFYVHKALSIQVEANLIRPEGAFRYNDYELPTGENNLISQFLGRVVYNF